MRYKIAEKYIKRNFPSMKCRHSIERVLEENKKLKQKNKDLKETNNKLQNENSYLKEDLTDIRIKFRKLTRQKEDEEYIENMPRLLICDCCLKPTKGDESVYFVNTGRRICFDCFSGAIKSEVKKSEEAKERKK